MKMDVSIIIVNYNTPTFTKSAIESVFEKTEGVAYELILVDNNSPDGSGQHLKDFFSEKIVYIQSDENIGFGRANNLGIEHAKGRNIFLLNPDTILLNNAVKILSDHIDNNPLAGVCGGNLYDENGFPTHSFSRSLPSVFFELNLLLRGLLFKIRYRKNTQFNYSGRVLKVAHITGADMMLRASIFHIIGGFDPDFFMYFEETELTHRIKKAGYQVYSVPKAKIIHYESKTSSNEIAKLEKVLTGRRIYYQKTCGYFGQMMVNTIYSLTILSGLGVAVILGNKQKYQYWFSAWQLMH